VQRVSPPQGPLLGSSSFEVPDTKHSHPLTDDLQSSTRSRGLTTSRSITSRPAASSQGPVPSEESSANESIGGGASRERRERGPGELLNHWMLPVSWVPKLAVTREAFDTR
jgi:hypothetical protein